jgi:hypothetical protein
MHHAAVNAELARLRNAERVAAAERRRFEGHAEPAEPSRSDPAFLDALFSLAVKLLPELHNPRPNLRPR